MEKQIKHLNEYLNEGYTRGLGEPVNEGLKDLLSKVKKVFSDAFTYMKNFVVTKLKSKYFVAIGKDGNAIPAVLPVNMGVAWNEGHINKENSYVILNDEDNKIVNCKTSIEGALDSLPTYKQCKTRQGYWKYLMKLNENRVDDADMINEVKLENEDSESKYNTITTDDELWREVMAHYKFRNKDISPLLILGAPGIGKTAIFNSVAKKLRETNPKFRLIIKTLSTETADSFTLPEYIYDSEGNKIGSRDIPKDWLPVYKTSDDPDKNAENDAACGEGILFLDELARAKETTRNPLLGLLEGGTFGTDYHLGSGWAVMAATNREEDEQEGQTKLGTALLDRFDKVFYEPCFKTWEAWAKKQNYISPIILSWLNMPSSSEFGGSKFYYYDANEEKGAAEDPTCLLCSPRSWTKLCKYMAEMASDPDFSPNGKAITTDNDMSGTKLLEVPEQIIISAMRGHVPALVIDKFLAFLHLIESVGNLDELIDAAWSGKKVKPITSSTLAKVSLPLAQMILCKFSKTLPSEQEWTNFSKWVVDQNSDQLASYILDICRNMWMPELVKNDNKGLCDLFFLWPRAKAMKMKAGRSQEIKHTVDTLNTVLKKFDMTEEDLPNYYEGISIMGKKYGDTFKKAVVNGEEALG